MTQESQIPLSETIVLIDTAFLNLVVTDMKAHFESELGRTLPNIHVAELTTFLMQDAGIEEDPGEVQFLFIYDNSSTHLAHCQPSDLEKELNGVAFQNTYGEYIFASVPSAGMVDRGNIFVELLSILGAEADVKKIVVVSFNEEYGDEVTEAMNNIKDKELIQFRMDEPEEDLPCDCNILAFPIMRAFGIKADELG